MDFGVFIIFTSGLDCVDDGFQAYYTSCGYQGCLRRLILLWAETCSNFTLTVSETFQCGGDYRSNVVGREHSRIITCGHESHGTHMI